ncbi:MAG TPA: glycosyltransferase [Solirubrobacterales bacterium]|nr:glycosyltransferase [Solirubrobacterales bacterium]
MIFATVGSHPTYRFERFLSALEALPAGEDLVVQYGPGTPPANAARAVPWMTFAEIVEQMELAEHVVSHAGAGTILCASGVGQIPIVFPRLQRFGETVDDHQVELARRLAEDGRLVVVESAPELVEAVAAAPPRGARAALEAGAELIAAVRGELKLS